MCSAGNGYIKIQSKGRRLGCSGLVLYLAKAFERVSLPVVWAWATHFSFPKENSAGALRVLGAPEASLVRTICDGAAPDHQGQSGFHVLCSRMH